MYVAIEKPKFPHFPLSTPDIKVFQLRSWIVYGEKRKLFNNNFILYIYYIYNIYII